MTVDGAWLGDPESTPCEMGGGPLVDYGSPCPKPAVLKGWVTVATMNAKLERAARTCEEGGRHAAAAAIRRMKEIA